MAASGWHKYMLRLVQTVTGRARQQTRRNPTRVCYRKLKLERLEDRLAPATDITIVAGAAGTGNLDHFLSASNGTITTANDSGDTNATLSTGALEGVGAGVAISITADATIHFDAIGTLALQTGSGVNASFATNTGAIDFANPFNTVSTGGGGLSFSAGTDLTIADLNTDGGDVSLTAGTTGPTGAGGNLQLENILTSDAGALTFQATHGTINAGTITQSGSSGASGLAITATADGDILVAGSLSGTTVDLTSHGSRIDTSGIGSTTAFLRASSKLTLSAANGISVHTTATPSVEASNSTSGTIGITQLASPAQTLTVTGSGVVNNAGGDGVLLVNDGGSIAIAAGSTVQSIGGIIDLEALDFQIGGTINAGSSGNVNLANSTPGQQIDIGTNTAGKIGLTQAELNEVTAGVLGIGSNTSGNINVSAAITPPPMGSPGSWNTLTLSSGDTITEDPAGSLTVPNLYVQATSSVSLLSANDVGTLAGSTSTSNTASFSFSNGGNLLTVGTVGLSGITTSGSDIHLVADDMNLTQPVTTGSSSAGIVTLEPATASEAIDLGVQNPLGTKLALTDAELNEVTAGVLRIGSSNFTGDIQATLGINPTHIGALSLITTGSGTIGQSFGATISVDSGTGGLAVQANTGITLNFHNNVGKLAAAITGTGNGFSFSGDGGYTVSTVDGVAGISTHTTGGEIVSLSASGSVMQDTGASIISDNLLLGGLGSSYELNDPGNDVDTLAANVTIDLSYTDSDDLTIGTVSSTSGVTSTNGSVTITTVAGDLTLNKDVGAGPGTSISLTAGSTNSSPNHTLTDNATIKIGSLHGVITLKADQMSLGSGIIQTPTGTNNVVQLEPFTTGQAVDLGGNGSGTRLSLTQADLNPITTDILRVGNSTAGDLTVTGAIAAPTGAAGMNPGVWDTLSLLSGNSILEYSSGSLTVNRLAVQAGFGVYVSGPFSNSVNYLAGTDSDHGEFDFVNTKDLVVSTVDGVSGVKGVGTSTTPFDLVHLSGAAGTKLTVSQQISIPNGAMYLSFDNMEIDATVSAPSGNSGIGNDGVVQLKPFSDNQAIHLGGPDSATILGLDDTELDHITAGKVLRIGSEAQKGAITIVGPVTKHAGYNTLDLIATGTGGEIFWQSGAFTVANLALQADAGIGSGLVLTGPMNLAFRNNSSSQVYVYCNGALTITAVDELDGTIGHTIGNFATTGTTTTDLHTSSPITFAINTTSSGTLNVSTMETGSEAQPGGTPLSSPDDDITVNSGVTVESTSGDVDFTSGDSIVTGSGSLVKSDSGAVKLTAGQGDNDNDATLDLSGGISSGSGVTLKSPGDICVSGINASGQTVTITSTGGAILDCGDATQDETDITADTVNLNAATGIGVAGPGVDSTDTPIEIQASTLSFSNTTSGDVNIWNVSGDLSASGSNSAPGGAVALLLENGGKLTVNASGVTSTDNLTAPFTNSITLIADTMALTGPVNAHSAFVQLEPESSGRQIDLGTSPSSGKLGLSQSDLDKVTAGDLHIGGLGVGSITITAPITDGGTGWSEMSLFTSSGGISETLNGALSVTSLAAVAKNSIILTQDNAVSNVSADSYTGGFSFEDTKSLTVTTVANVIGISTHGYTLLNAAAVNTTLKVNDTVTTNGKSGIAFNFDIMSLNSPVVAAGNQVLLEPYDTGRQIDLGTNPSSSKLGLAQSDLGNITANLLVIGDSLNSGAITISNAITLTEVPTLDLETAGGISETSTPNAGTISVANLALHAANAVSMTQANNVSGDSLAADVTGAGQGFSFTNAGNLTIGTATGFNGITTNNGAITVNTSAGNLTVNKNVSAGAAPINLTAAGNLLVLVGSAVQSSDAVSLTGGSGGASAAVTVTGQVTGSTVTVSGGSGADVFTINVAAGSSSIVTVTAVPAGSPASDNDTFDVTPSSVTTYIINGSDGTGSTEAAPGDTLNIALAGTSGGALSITSQNGDDLSGYYTFSNRAPVIFRAIDILNPPAPFPPPPPPPTPPVPPPAPPAITQVNLFQVAMDAVFTAGGFVNSNSAAFFAGIADFDSILSGFLTGSSSDNQAVMTQVMMDAFLIVDGAETGNAMEMVMGLENMNSLASSLSSTAGQLVATYEQDLLTAIFLATMA